MRKPNLPLTVFAVLLLLDELTPLDIDRLIIWLVITPVVLVAAVWPTRSARPDWARTSRIGFIFALFIVMKLLSWHDWRTDTIEYQHRYMPYRAIEFQLMNPGPGSYQRRRVDRIRLLPGVSWTREIDEQSIDPQAWQRVDVEVNEMGLKYP